jgi:hypothetical protein
MRPRRLELGFALSLLPLAACASDSNTEDDAADEGETAAESETADCDPPTLELHNMTGNTIELVHFYACDMSDGNDYPLPPPGLANGESASIPFPGPGCWVLEYEGEGCFSDMPEMPPELDCGDSHTWTADLDHHICQG